MRNAGFAAREPRSLPDGFAPVEGNLVEIRGVRTLHLLYGDGIRTVSLFENAKASTLDATRLKPQSLRVGRRSAEYAEDGATALLAWSDGTLYYTLVGEVGVVDLARIAALDLIVSESANEEAPAERRPFFSSVWQKRA